MSIWNAKITEKGDALLTKLTQGHTLEITHAEIGSGTVDASLLSQQTSVSSVKQTAQLQPVGYPEDGKCALPVNITNAGVTASFNAWQIGVFATDPDEGSILFFLAQAEDAATNIPSENLTPSYSTEIIFIVKFGQADSVEVTVDPANTVTQAGMVNYVSTEISAVKEEIQKVSGGLISNAMTPEKVKTNLDSAEIVTTAGTGAAYTATVPGITALKAGVSFIMVPHTVSTTTQPTLDVNGLGAKPLRQPLTSNTGATTTATSNSWISSGKPVRVMYDGTLWEIDIPRPSATALYGSVPIYNGGHGGSTVEEARENLGVAAADHTHTPEELGAAAKAHEHSSNGVSSLLKHYYMDMQDPESTAFIYLGKGENYAPGLWLITSNAKKCDVHLYDTVDSSHMTKVIEARKTPLLLLVTENTVERTEVIDVINGTVATAELSEDGTAYVISTSSLKPET